MRAPAGREGEWPDTPVFPSDSPVGDRSDVRTHRIFGVMGSSYLIETPEALFLVDAGFKGHGRTILRKIRTLGRSPEELRLVIITHGHLDHFGGLAELLEAHRIPVGAHPAHAEVIARGIRIISPGRTRWGRTYERVARRAMRRVRTSEVGPVLPLIDEQELHDFGLPARVIYTPGHSDGCISVLLDDNTAITGDLVQGKRLPTRVPELPGMVLDVARSYASWRRILDAGAQRFLPGHSGPFDAEELVATMRRDGVELPASRSL